MGMHFESELLNVKIVPDCHLVVSISVAGDTASSLSSTSPKNQTIRRHRSGNGARKRRQLQRSKAPVLSNLKKDDDDDTMPENVNEIATNDINSADFIADITYNEIENSTFIEDCEPTILSLSARSEEINQESRMQPVPPTQPFESLEFYHSNREPFKTLCESSRLSSQENSNSRKEDLENLKNILNLTFSRPVSKN